MSDLIMLALGITEMQLPTTCMKLNLAQTFSTLQLL